MFYVFYEQYLTIVASSVTILLMSFLVVMVISFVLLGLDLWSTIIIGISIVMILFSMLALMYLWNIPLNAISLVNLVMVCFVGKICKCIIKFFCL